MAELARLAGHALGVALRADRGDDVRALALDRERARAHRLAGAARHRVGLAREDRLVDAKTGRLRELAVGDHLVARPDADEIVDDHVVDRKLARLAVADDARGRRDERGKAVERVLGADLLRDADAGVRDEDEQEQRVLPARRRPA